MEEILVGGPHQRLGGRSKVAVFNVHGIGSPPRPLDHDEDKTWITVEQFEGLLDVIVGRDDVRLTFDDGNSSDLEIGLPLLLERGLTAEFFLPAGLLGEPGRLDASGVVELHRAGMTIGSHGWAHRDWRRLEPSQRREEFGDARRVLAELVGGSVSRAAVPFGSYDRHVLRTLRRSGVTCVYTSDGGWTHSQAWIQARTSARADHDSDWARTILESRPSLIRRARGVAARTVKRVRG